MSRQRALIGRIFAVIACVGVGCFRGAFARGEPCESSDDCGSLYTCDRGWCDGCQARSCDARCRGADVLIVLDGSEAFRAVAVSEFQQAVREFGLELRAGINDLCSFRLALASALPHEGNPSQCREPGSLVVRGSVLGDCLDSALPFATECDPSIEDSITSCAGVVGTEEVVEGTFSPLRAVERALFEAQGAGDCNAGFSQGREDAALLVFITATRDDETDVDPAELAASLRASRSGPIHVYSTVADACVEEKTPRLAQFTSAFETGGVENLCGTAQEISEMFSRVTSTFFAAACESS